MWLPSFTRSSHATHHQRDSLAKGYITRNSEVMQVNHIGNAVKPIQKLTYLSTGTEIDKSPWGLGGDSWHFTVSNQGPLLPKELSDLYDKSLPLLVSAYLGKVWVAQFDEWQGGVYSSRVHHQSPVFQGKQVGHD